jgi:hypothetical protein
VIKNFPLRMLWQANPASKVRYFWHAVSLVTGQGSAAEFRRGGHAGALLPFLVLRAQLVALWRLPELWRERRKIFRRISPQEFQAIAKRHSISLRKVAEL